MQAQLIEKGTVKICKQNWKREKSDNVYLLPISSNTMKAPSMEVSTPALRSMVASKGNKLSAPDNMGAGEGTDTADAVTLSFPATFSPFQPGTSAGGSAQRRA